MKKIFFIALVSAFVFLNCLKAKRSPFDVSKPSPGLAGTIAGILNGSFSSSLSTTSTTTTNPTTGTTTTTSLPSVTSTSPADASTGIIANTPITITFNMTMDKTSITTNSDDTTCSGSVQISFDNFATCVKMRSTISTTDNKTFTLNANPTMGTFATHKIKVSTTAKTDTSVNLASNYSHATGFTTATPCTVYDAVTCPIPFSLAATMTLSLGNGGMVIPIESGAAKGKIFVVNGSSTTTNIFNPETGIFSVSPNTTALVNQNSQSTYFFINSGSNTGKILIVHGGSNTTSIYDPVSNTMVTGPPLTTATAANVNSFPISYGIHSGKTMVQVNGLTTNFYDPSTNSFFLGPALSLPLGNSAHSINIPSGANSGKTLIIHSGNTTDVSIYEPSSGIFTVGPNLNPFPNYGAHSFIIPSGLQSGNILIARGNTSNNTFIFNANNLTVSAGPSLPSLIDNDADSGTHSILISSGINQGKIWLIHAAMNPPSSSSFYDPNTNSFSSGPTMITRARLNSKTVYIESGIYSGKYMTFYGGAQFTSLYDPIKNAIDASSILPSAAGAGVNRIPITTGTNAGKTLVINGGNNTSSLFDFASGTFTAGPNLTGVMGKSPGLFTISGGTQDGKTLVVHGGGITTTSLYDPGTNTFSAGPALSAAANNITNECIFKVPSGTQVGKYLIILSSASQNTSLYDPSNNTIAAGPATGGLMGVGGGVTCFPITSGANAGKFIATQGMLSATATRMYDPATNTFGAGPTLASSITTGSFSMPITSGANSGKVLIVIGTGTTTNLYDPTSHSFSIGPNLSASATGGVYLLLTVGANKDKYWIMHGNTSSIYDPNTNTITAGIALPDGGSMAFNVTSGLFNQGVLVVTGNGNLTSVLYP